MVERNPHGAQAAAFSSERTSRDSPLTPLRQSHQAYDLRSVVPLCSNCPARAAAEPGV
jgi:hypothetical protein